MSCFNLSIKENLTNNNIQPKKETHACEPPGLDILAYYSVMILCSYM